MSHPDLVDTVTAAAMLQPHVAPLNSANWLTDMRRGQSNYRRIVLSLPQYLKYEGRIHYPKTEIERMIGQIQYVRNSPLTLS